MNVRGKDWVHPLTRPIVAASVPNTGLEVTITPSAEERALMARALNLAAVDHLTADLKLAPRAGGIIAVTGELRSKVQPVCVVSLEPFALSIREPVDIRFTDRDPESRRPPRPGTEEDVSGEDPPDPIENGMIDLGHVVTEFLSLALPMYPRKPGADFEKAAEPEKRSPFDQLKALKTRE